jgi:Bacterial EndoU nuclease
VKQSAIGAVLVLRSVIPVGDMLDLIGGGSAAGEGATVAEEGGLVNLASDARTERSLSGQMPPGEPGNSLFPSDWSAAKIMNAVSEVVTDPANEWVQQTGRLARESCRQRLSTR